MELKEFNKAVAQANFGARYFDKHTSPDFQCDLTGGMPVCLVWNKIHNKCWLEYPDISYDWMQKNRYKYDDIEEYEQLLADWGVRDCPDEASFNAWLDTFGKENVENCYINIEEQENEYEY